MRKDDVTAELPGLPKRRGRPPTGKAMSAAERQKAYRKRMAGAGRDELPSVWVQSDVLKALNAYVERQNADVAAEPVTLGDAVDRILRAYLLRKR